MQEQVYFLLVWMVLPLTLLYLKLDKQRVIVRSRVFHPRNKATGGDGRNSHLHLTISENTVSFSPVNNQEYFQIRSPFLQNLLAIFKRLYCIEGHSKQHENYTQSHVY